MDVVVYQAEAEASPNPKPVTAPVAANDNDIGTYRLCWAPELV